MPDYASSIVISKFGVLPHIGRGEQVTVRDDIGFVHSAGEEVEVLTPPEQELYFLRVHQAHIEMELERLLDHPVTKQLKFHPELYLNSSAGNEMASCICGLYRAIETARDKGVCRQSRIVTLENHLILLLLSSQRHNYTSIVNRRSDIASSSIRRAIEFIEANAETGLTLGEIAVAAGTNARTLQHAFHKHAECSPLQYLRRFRLQRAHAELKFGDGSGTVTEVATRWGFFHFGRFAIEYRKTFGEKPSETLKG